MATHKIQIQRVYGAPSDRSYRRLRLPKMMTEDYIDEHGENLFIKVVAPDTLMMGGPSSGGIPVHLLDVKERRGIAILHYRQVMLPGKISGGMNRGDQVDITREGDMIVLKFGRAIFEADERTVAGRPPSVRADTHDAAPDGIERRLAGIESAVDRLGARIRRIEGRLGR